MSLKQRREEMRAAMERARLAEPPTFIPHKLLDSLIEEMGLKNDAELSRSLGVPPPVISQIRHRKLGVGATMLLRMHEESNVSIAVLKDLLKASEKKEAPIARRPVGGGKSKEEDEATASSVVANANNSDHGNAGGDMGAVGSH